METLQLVLIGYVVVALVITITTIRDLRQDPWWFYLLWFAVAPLALLAAIVGWALTRRRAARDLIGLGLVILFIANYMLLLAAF